MDSTLKINDTKQKITEAALELFANQGFHKTSISLIAKSVGVSKSLIYNYFNSKDHLLEFIVEDAIHRSIAHTPNNNWNDINSLDQVLEYLNNMVQDLKANPSYYRLLVLLSLQGSVKQKIVSDLMRQKEQLILPLKKVLDKAPIKDTEKMTYLFGALFDGMVLHYLYMEEKYPLDELFSFYIEQFKKLLQQ